MRIQDAPCEKNIIRFNLAEMCKGDHQTLITGVLLETDTTSFFMLFRHALYFVLGPAVIMQQRCCQ